MRLKELGGPKTDHSQAALIQSGKGSSSQIGFSPLLEVEPSLTHFTRISFKGPMMLGMSLKEVLQPPTPDFDWSPAY